MRSAADNRLIEISVVIPCLNEAETLGTCIRKALRCFQKHDLRGEVVVVDNGSQDGSQQIVKEAGARLIEQSVRGYGAALRKGFDEAQGTFVLMGDADDSYDFSDIHRFVFKLREGYDLVMGTRINGTIQPAAMPWLHRYLGNPVLTFILNVLYRSGISDAHCGMRGFRKEVVEKMDLRSPGMEFASEMVIKAVRAGLRITEIPITLYPAGRKRPPHLRSFPDGWRHLRLMLMLAPDILFIWPGMILSALSLFAQTAIFFYGPLTVGSVKFAENTMIFCMMATIVAFQLLYLGFFSHLYIYSGGFQGTDRLTRIIYKLSKFERGIILGGIIFFIGFLGDTAVFFQWYQREWGDLDLGAIRNFIFFSTLLILGFQTIISAFLLNMIGVDRSIYMGSIPPPAAIVKKNLERAPNTA